jgi:hypothetical protein
MAVPDARGATHALDGGTADVAAATRAIVGRP